MLTRRRFVQSTALAGAALMVGFKLDGLPALAAEEVFAPNAFIRIAPDNTVTIIGKHIEFGQGSYTGLATILAEELGPAFDAAASARSFATLAASYIPTRI